MSLPSPVVNGVPLLVGSTAPQWGGENVDIGNYALAVEVNTNATVPTQYKLVIFTGAPTTVTIASTSSTTGVEGICVGNCGGSIAQIARAGVAGCIFDTTTIAGHYVQASTSNAGECKDVGATYPTNGNQVIGRVLASVGSTGQTVNVMLYAPGIWTQLPLLGTGTVYQTTSVSGTTPTGDVVTYDANANTQDSGTLLTSLAPKASPTFTGTPAEGQTGF